MTDFWCRIPDLSREWNDYSPDRILDINDGLDEFEYHGRLSVLNEVITNPSPAKPPIALPKSDSSNPDPVHKINTLVTLWEGHQFKLSEHNTDFLSSLLNQGYNYSELFHQHNPSHITQSSKDGIDGVGSMLVASPLDSKNTLAHHDPSYSVSLSQVANMEAATALDTQAQNAPDLVALNNGVNLAAQDALHNPVYQSQSAHANGIEMGLHIPQLPQPSNPKLNAFAKLRFDDGAYYMQTYQIILGRDLARAEKEMRRQAKENMRADDGVQNGDSLQEGARSEQKGTKDRERHVARSVISERGGIVNAPVKSMPFEYHQRRQSVASQSQSSASHPNGDPAEEVPTERAPQDMIMQAFPEVPAQIDGDVIEDPSLCPIVPIHPQHRTIGSKLRGISRRHAKIFYDFQQACFCLEVLGSNGMHHENSFLQKGEVVILQHEDNILIGSVNIQFFLPNTDLEDDQSQRQDSSSRPMSFAFENGFGEAASDEEMSSESEGELSINPRHVYHHPIDSDIESDQGLPDEDLDLYEDPIPRQKQSLKLKFKAPPLISSQKFPKRKRREPSPEDLPLPAKRMKSKSKESTREPVKHGQRASKEPADLKDKGKTPAKVPAKMPIKADSSADEQPKETPMKEKGEISTPSLMQDVPLLRKARKEEVEAGDVEGLLTPEMIQQYNLSSELIGHVMERRKGPGRPPKDGFLSKRQRSQLAKIGKEMERAKAAGIDPANIPAPSVKPRPPKRKESIACDGEDDDVLDSTEKGDGSGVDKKFLKPVKPPRTPSPEMRETDYTEAQLQRPESNYVVLIHEAISSASTKQMNLQQIYNYIEKKHPYFKFKTMTSGWQSSVRHNLGQHDAFIKGDKEGKGYNWKINPAVSIEKERRKRGSPPPGTQRSPYYQPLPNGYPVYAQPGYTYPQGIQHATLPTGPRLPPSLAQPRLPPSMARDANAAASNAACNTPLHASPYASPWGGNSAGSPTGNIPPRPYPPTSNNIPPPSPSQAAPTGQYGVLFPTTAPSPHSGIPTSCQYGGSQYATAGSPYPPQSTSPYPPTGQQPGASASGPPLHSPQGHMYGLYLVPPPSTDRYPTNTPSDLIRILETFRAAYLKKRKDDGSCPSRAHEVNEEKKVDNAIRACVDPTVPEGSLTEAERQVLMFVRGTEGIAKHLPSVTASDNAGTRAVNPTSANDMEQSAVAVAADAANKAAIAQSHLGQVQATPRNTVSQTEPLRCAPSMAATSTVSSSTAGSTVAVPVSHRPSVEPLTPLPDSPLVPNGTCRKASVAESAKDEPSSAAEASSAAEGVVKVDINDKEINITAS